MNDKLSIKLNIGDRNYPLKIERSEEEKIRKAAKLINERILQYKNKYNEKDMQDYLAMTALQFVIKNIEQEELHDLSPVLSELEDIHNELTEVLNKE